nr:hypothetical protein [uncultured Dyadobacter sp.]
MSIVQIFSRFIAERARNAALCYYFAFRIGVFSIITLLVEFGTGFA